MGQQKNSLGKEVKIDKKLKMAQDSSFEILVLGIGNALLAIYDYFVHSSSATWFGVTPPFDFISLLILFSLGFSIFSATFYLIEPLRYNLYEYQQFSSIWRCIFVFVSYLLFLLLGMFFILTKNHLVDIYGNPLTIPLLVGTFILYGLSTYWNIKELKADLATDKDRSTDNQQTLERIVLFFSFAAMFVFLLGDFLFKGRTVNVFGVLLLVGMTILFPRSHVKSVYAAMLKRQDRKYWSVYKPEDAIQYPWRKIFFVVRLIVEIGIFWTCVTVGTDILPKTSPFQPFLRWTVIGIMVYWAIRIMIWLIRKWRGR